jgi:hypothetical protein
VFLTLYSSTSFTVIYLNEDLLVVIRFEVRAELELLTVVELPLRLKLANINN